MGTPIYRKMREVQFAAGGRQIEPSFPLIDARFSGTPIHRKMWEVQFAAAGRQIAQTFPIIDARIFGNAQSIVKRGRCNFPPEGGKLHRLFHSPMPDFLVFHQKKVRRSTKGSVQVQVQPTPPSAMSTYKHSSDLFQPLVLEGCKPTRAESTRGAQNKTKCCCVAECWGNPALT